MANTTKSITTLAVVAVAGIIALLFVFVAPIRPMQTAQAVVEEPKTEDTANISFQFFEPESYVEQTGKSAVVVQVTSERIPLQRGDSTNIEVLARHLGGENADQSVNVKVLLPTGYTLYPPSVAKSTTPEDRFDAAKAGTILPGGIDLREFMSISGESEKAVAESTEQLFTVTIRVPADLPDELVGEEIYIPINVETTDGSGNAVPGKSTGVMVVVS